MHALNGKKGMFNRPNKEGKTVVNYRSWNYVLHGFAALEGLSVR